MMADTDLRPGPRDHSDYRLALRLVLGVALVRVIAGAFLGLGVDEAYAVAVGRDWSWSYFDHPPLTFWLAHGASLLFGSEAHLVVRAPFLILGAGSALLVYLLTEQLFGSRAGLWALGAWSIAPFFQISAASWIVPDGPLQFFLLLTAWAVWPLMTGRALANGRRWLWVGVALGLALLSKYHGFFFAGGALIFLITTARGRAWLATPWPYLAGLLALVMFSPVIYWNAAHSWPSMTFHSARAGDGGFIASLFNGLRMIAGELLYVLPGTLVVGVWAAVSAARRGPADNQAWFCLCLGAPAFVAFNLVAFTSTRSLPHWPLPGFLLFLPLVGLWLEKQAKTRLRSNVWAFGAGGAFTALLLAGLVVHAGTGLLTRPFTAKPPRWDDTTQVADWDVVAGAVEKLRVEKIVTDETVIAARNWLEAAKLDYALSGDIAVVVLDSDRRHFHFSSPINAFIGKPALFIALTKPGRRDSMTARAFSGEFTDFCAETALPPIDWPRGGVHYAGFAVIEGRIC